MSLAGSTGVWEVRSLGSDANAGYVNSATVVTDYSQQNSAQLSLTDVVTNGTTTVTSVAGGFTSAMVGNGINIAGIVYLIAAVTDAHTITVDRTIGAASGQIGKVGGACASLGYVASQMVGSNTVWIKADGTYNVGNGAANTAGNAVSSLPAGAATAFTRVFGYHTTRWSFSTGPLADDLSNKPLFQTANTFNSTIFNDGGSAYVTINNIQFDGGGANGGSSVGLSTSGYGTLVFNVKVSNISFGAVSSGQATYANCEAMGCAQNGFGSSGTQPVTYHACTSHGNTANGFSTACGVLIDCIAYANGAAGYNNGQEMQCINCTAFGNTGDGFLLSGGYGHLVRNCISYGNVGWQFNGGASAADGARLDNGAAGGGGSGNFHNVPRAYGSIALTANPFTNSAGVPPDLTLNATPGGGAACRGAGIPGSVPATAAPGSIDLGAFQHPAGPIIVIDD